MVVSYALLPVRSSVQLAGMLKRLSRSRGSHSRLFLSRHAPVQGCAMRCAFCSNPDTWTPCGGDPVSSKDIALQLRRCAMVVLPPLQTLPWVSAYRKEHLGVCWPRSQGLPLWY